MNKTILILLIILLILCIILSFILHSSSSCIKDRVKTKSICDIVEENSDANWIIDKENQLCFLQILYKFYNIIPCSTVARCIAKSPQISEPQKTIFLSDIAFKTKPPIKMRGYRWTSKDLEIIKDE